MRLSKNHVVIFEARGGSDKGPYGYRVDSMPIVQALQARSWSAEIIFYSDEHRGEIYRYTLERAAAWMHRPVWRAGVPTPFIIALPAGWSSSVLMT